MNLSYQPGNLRLLLCACRAAVYAKTAYVSSIDLEGKKRCNMQFSALAWSLPADGF